MAAISNVEDTWIQKSSLTLLKTDLELASALVRHRSHKSLRISFEGQSSTQKHFDEKLSRMSLCKRTESLNWTWNKDRGIEQEISRERKKIKMHGLGVSPYSCQTQNHRLSHEKNLIKIEWS